MLIFRGIFSFQPVLVLFWLLLPAPFIDPKQKKPRQRLVGDVFFPFAAAFLHQPHNILKTRMTSKCPENPTQSGKVCSWGNMESIFLSYNFKVAYLKSNQWMVVSTHLKNICQVRSFLQVRVKIKNA